MAEPVSRSLVLRGSCDGVATKPTLMDYIAIFPNLVSVKIDLAYRIDHTLDDRRPYRAAKKMQPSSTLKKRAHSLNIVSLSMEKEGYWNGTRQEGMTSKIVSHLKASMKDVGINMLDSYHLEIATSRSKDDREDRTYWSDLGKRIMSACTIPARKVSLDIGEIRMEGEASNFVVSCCDIGRRYGL